MEEYPNQTSNAIQFFIQFLNILGVRHSRHEWEIYIGFAKIRKKQR